MTDTTKPRFRYSAYWRTWSLVLTDRFISSPPAGRTAFHNTVEINLSPVNGWERCGDAEIKRMKGIIVRVHCTPSSPKDDFAHELPAEVELALAAHLGWDAVNWLLDPTTEILGIIDWQRHREISNGGARLVDCVAPRFADRLPRITGSETTATILDGLRAGVIAPGAVQLVH